LGFARTIRCKPSLDGNGTIPSPFWLKSFANSPTLPLVRVSPAAPVGARFTRSAVRLSFAVNYDLRVSAAAFSIVIIISFEVRLDLVRTSRHGALQLRFALVDI